MLARDQEEKDASKKSLCSTQMLMLNSEALSPQRHGLELCTCCVLGTLWASGATEFYYLTMEFQMNTVSLEDGWSTSVGSCFCSSR
jgi:hypothetical protein